MAKLTLSANQKNLFSIFSVIFILVSIPVTVFTVLTLRQLPPKAATPASNLGTRATAGLLGKIEESEVSYLFKFSYNPSDGKATLDSVDIAPHGILAVNPPDPSNVSLELLITDSKGKKNSTKRVFKKSESGSVEMLIPFARDGKIEVVDNLGRVAFKDQIKNLPRPTSLPAQALYSQIDRGK